MKGITWSRDSHGLFDYESRHLVKKTMKSFKPSQIVRKAEHDLDIVALQENDSQTSEEGSIEKPLLKITNQNSKSNMFIIKYFPTTFCSRKNLVRFVHT